MRLARTQRGTMIHNRDCRYARNGTAWLWADKASDYDVWKTVHMFNYQTCKHCKPLGA